MAPARQATPKCRPRRGPATTATTTWEERPMAEVGGLHAATRAVTIVRAMAAIEAEARAEAPMAETEGLRAVAREMVSVACCEQRRAAV